MPAVLEPAKGDAPLAITPKDTGTETTGEADFVSRDQQLRSKQAKKQNKKDKNGKNGKKANAKNGKRKQKKKSKAGKGSRNVLDQRRGRKRNILAAASSTPASEAVVEEQPAKQKKARKTKNAQPEDSSPKEPDQAPAVKAKAAKRPPKGEPKAKRQPKAKAEPKAKAKGKKREEDDAAKDEPKAKRGKKKVSAEDAMLANPLRMDTLVSALMDFAKRFEEELEAEESLEALKSRIRSELQPLKKCSLNVYWSRNSCGVRVWRSEAEKAVVKDELHFSFNSSSAPRRYKLAVAVRCAELAATWRYIYDILHGYIVGGKSKHHDQVVWI